jgi:hypothetical protein
MTYFADMIVLENSKLAPNISINSTEYQGHLFHLLIHAPLFPAWLNLRPHISYQ